MKRLESNEHSELDELLGRLVEETITAEEFSRLESMLDGDAEVQAEGSTHAADEAAGLFDN